MSFRLLALSLFALTISHSSFGQLPIIHATSKSVDIRDGDQFRKGQWTLMPDLKPDEYQTFVKKKKTVTFYTDQDSISFNVKPKKEYDFIILLNGRDSCWTRITGMQDVPAVQFTPKFINANKGKYSFEVPEVQELVHIIFAITPTGINDQNMVEHNTEYYKTVMEHFGPWKEDKIVKSINKLLKNGLYARFKMDACGFQFQGNKIKKHPNYNRLNWGNSNYVAPYLKELEDFAQKSDFRAFYQKHQSYYQELIKKMEAQTPIQKQWTWLEERFPNRYDNYWITFSPLVNGSHSTNRFEQNGFKQSAMFICGPIESTKLSKPVIEGLMTRVVFTEIDHNYVNPVSDRYLDDISAAMSNRKKWAEGQFTGNYGNAYSVFNEYMTWGVFTLYAKDQFDEESFKAINERVEKQMEQWRGFVHFRAFNQKLLKAYESLPKGDSLESLYPIMLDWCKAENEKT